MLGTKSNIGHEIGNKDRTYTVGIHGIFLYNTKRQCKMMEV